MSEESEITPIPQGPPQPGGPKPVPPSQQPGTPAVKPRPVSHPLGPQPIEDLPGTDLDAELKEFYRRERGW